MSYRFDGVHLMADTLDELHAKAKSIGLKPEWFQAHPQRISRQYLAQLNLLM